MRSSYLVKAGNQAIIGPMVGATLLIAFSLLLLPVHHSPAQSFSAYEYKSLGPFGDYVWDVQFSPSGNYMAFTTGNNFVYLYDTNFNQVWSYQGNSSYFSGSVSFTPDGQFLVFARYQSETDLAVLRLSDRQVIQRLTGHSAKVSSVSVSGDGRFLASCTTTGEVKLWKQSGSSYFEVSNTTPHSGWTNELAFSPDNKYVASGAMSGDLKVQEISGDNVYNTQSVYKSGSGQAYSVAFSPDGQLLVAGTGKDPTVFQRSGGQWTKLQTLFDGSGWVWDVSFSPDGRYIASASGSSEIKIWMKSGASFTQTKTLYGHSGGINCLAFSPDGAYLASGSSDNTVKVWKVSGVSAGGRVHKGSTVSGTILFEDDFSNNYNNWAEQDDGTVYLKVEYGKYYIRDYDAMRKSWKTIQIDQSQNFRIESTIQKVDGPNNNSCGMFWGGDDDNNYYLFSFSGDGHYLVARYYNGNWEYLINWTKSGVINQNNGTNKLAVEKIGNKLKFFINDTYVDETAFNYFFGDYVGFAAASKIKIGADRLVVTQGSSGAAHGGGFSETDRFDNGLKYMNSQNYQAAISEFLSVIQSNPNHAEAHSNLGINYLNLGDYDNAIFYGKKAIDLKPDFADPFNTVGIAYTYKKDYDQGILYFRQHYGMTEDKSLSAYNLACCYSLQNQVDEALIWLEEALKNGYTDFNWLQQDSDLQNIRYDSRFNEILSRYQGGGRY